MKKPLAFVIAVSDNLIFAAGTIAISLNRYMTCPYELLVYAQNICESDRMILEKIPNVKVIDFKLEESFIDYMLSNLPKGCRFCDARKLMRFCHYEAFAVLDEYETAVWIDADMSIQGDLASVVEYVPFGITLDTPWKVRNQFIDSIDGFDMERDAFCTGFMVLSDTLPYKDIYRWLYAKTKEYAPFMKNGDQAIINLMLQEFNIYPNIMPLNQYQCICTSRDAITAKVVHFGTDKKVWNDAGILNCFPEWYRVYLEWISLGGTPSEEIGNLEAVNVYNICRDFLNVPQNNNDIRNENKVNATDLSVEGDRSSQHQQDSIFQRIWKRLRYTRDLQEDCRERLVHIESKVDGEKRNIDKILQRCTAVDNKEERRQAISQKNYQINESERYLIKKKYSAAILGNYTNRVYGKDNWHIGFFAELAEMSCTIVAAFESIESEEIHNYSSAEFGYIYSRVDYVFVVPGYEEKMKELLNQYHIPGEKVYVYRDRIQGEAILEHLGINGRISCNCLFSRRGESIRRMLYDSRYTLCDCSNSVFIVNSQYKLMALQLSSGVNYQQSDLVAFQELCEKYYGYSTNEKGYFLDIGANIGTSSIWFKKNVNDGVKIIGFEPLQENCKQFACNCILNDISENDYVIVNAGCSDENIDHALLQVDSVNMGDNRVIKNNSDSYSCETEDITLIRLDDWLSTNSINEKDVKYIWMDVQAHEKYAINGACKLLKNNRIPLFMEFWPKQIVSNGTLEALINEVGQYYTKFVVVQWYETDCKREYPIKYMEKIAKDYPDKSFDLFLIK